MSLDLKDQYYGCEIAMTGITRQQAAEAEAVPECAADTETAGAAESTGAETEEQNCGAPQEKTANNTTAEEEMPVVPEDKEEPLM